MKGRKEDGNAKEGCMHGKRQEWERGGKERKVRKGNNVRKMRLK